MLQSANKQWISPFLAVTFLAVSITGIIMLFHQKIPGINPIHQWGGVLFVIGGIMHLLLNWRPLKAYFNNQKALVGACAGVLSIVLLVALFPHTHDHDQDRHRGWDKGGRGYSEMQYRR